MKTITEQTTFRHKMAYYMGINYESYINIIEFYFKEYCCELQQRTGISAEQLETNEQLYNYYYNQWIIAENRMHSHYDVSVFTEDELFDMIDIYAGEINRYPQVLIKELKKQNS